MLQTNTFCYVKYFACLLEWLMWTWEEFEIWAAKQPGIRTLSQV